jgi:MFS family permease
MDEFLLNFFPTVYEKKHMAINTDYCKYDNQLLQLFTSSLYIAGLCAAFPASYTTRLYGRKWTMFMGGISFFVGAILNGAGQNLAMLVIGRILLGIGVGFASQVLNDLRLLGTRINFICLFIVNFAVEFMLKLDQLF